MSKVTGFKEQPTSSGLGICHSASLDCGHETYAGYYKTFPADIVIGSELACERCADIQKQVAWLESIDPKSVHHARFRPRFGGTYTFYKYDPSSPSCFYSIGGTFATPEIDAVLRRIGISPISPTEQA
jgi:hypothetical protein